jgi:two-component system chemotaxis response regulator CheB
MPPNAPGILIVQHMPQLFTKSFTKRLNSICAVEVKEAKDKEAIKLGAAETVIPLNKITPTILSLLN